MNVIMSTSREPSRAGGRRTTMMTRRGGALAALLTASLLTGCAGSVASPPVSESSGLPSLVPVEPSGKAAPVPGASVPGAPASGAPAPADPGGAAKPGGKPGAAGSQTLTGTVAHGVEPDCLMLTSAAGVHQLIISDAAARTAAAVGASVTVVGRPDPRMMTTCQQGTPFVVTQVRPN